MFFGVVTTSPAANCGTIRDAPLDVVECSTTKPWPPSEYIAPRAKSFWPPDDEKYVPSIVSDAHWPMKSTVSVALTDAKFGSLAMIRGSFTYRTAVQLDGGVLV